LLKLKAAYIYEIQITNKNGEVIRTVT